MIVVSLGIWLAISVVLVIILDVHGAADVFFFLVSLGPFAILGIAVSALLAKYEHRFRTSDSWWAIISAVFYVSIVVFSISALSFLTWVALKFISSL